MCLTKEFFNGRDETIKAHQDNGDLSVVQACKKLNIESSQLFAMGLLTTRDFTTASVNVTALTEIGGLFFTEQYQQIYITQEKCEQLRNALLNWNDFQIQREVETDQSPLTCSINVLNQKRFKLRCDDRSYLLSFTLKDIPEMLDDLDAIFHDNKSTTLLSAIWDDYCESIISFKAYQAISQNLLQPTNEADLINTSQAWHPLVRKLIKNKIKQLNFSYALSRMQKQYTKDNGGSVTWQSITTLFQVVRPEKPANNTNATAIEGKLEIELFTLSSIDSFACIQADKLKKRYLPIRSNERLILMQPGDIILYKSSDRPTVHIAYYHADNHQAHYASGLFCVLRPLSDNEAWNSQRLLTFLRSQLGVKILQTTFTDHSVRAIAQPKLMPRELSKLQLPSLSKHTIARLDQCFNESQTIQQQINALMYQVDEIQETVLTTHL